MSSPSANIRIDVLETSKASVISVAWRQTYFCPPGYAEKPYRAERWQRGGNFHHSGLAPGRWYLDYLAKNNNSQHIPRKVPKKDGNWKHRYFHQKQPKNMWHFQDPQTFTFGILSTKDTTTFPNPMLVCGCFRRLYKSPIPLYHLKLDISNARAWQLLHFLGLPGPLKLLRASFFSVKIGQNIMAHGWQATWPNFCIWKQLY